MGNIKTHTIVRENSQCEIFRHKMLIFGNYTMTPDFPIDAVLISSPYK